MYMSIPFQVYCNMNTKKFWVQFVTNIHIYKNYFRSYRKSILFCMNDIATLLPTFIIRLFFLSQYSNFFINSFTLCCKTSSPLSTIHKLVSSANKTNSASYTCKGRSLMHIKNRRGPCTEPCSTPCFSTLSEEKYLYCL